MQERGSPLKSELTTSSRVTPSTRLLTPVAPKAAFSMAA
jgi:hypothetical protein